MNSNVFVKSMLKIMLFFTEGKYLQLNFTKILTNNLNLLY